MAIVVARWVAASVAALGLMHVYWALGGRMGKSAAVPEVNGQQTFIPSRAGTMAVAAALFFAATVGAIAGRLFEPGGFKGIFRILAFDLSPTFLHRAVGVFRLVRFFNRVRVTYFALLETAI